jgi:Family of unknown function (DUF5372)
VIQIYLLLWARLQLTALGSNEILGSATITHPFHPLKGKKFVILSSRRIGNEDILSLAISTYGTLAIPREWTDQAAPDPYDSISSASRPILSIPYLVKLIELIKSSVVENFDT